MPYRGPATQFRIHRPPALGRCRPSVSDGGGFLQALAEVPPLHALCACTVDHLYELTARAPAGVLAANSATRQCTRSDGAARRLGGAQDFEGLSSRDAAGRVELEEDVDERGGGGGRSANEKRSGRAGGPAGESRLVVGQGTDARPQRLRRRSEALEDANGAAPLPGVFGPRIRSDSARPSAAEGEAAA